jgi:hypothetical protein
MMVKNTVPRMRIAGIVRKATSIVLMRERSTKLKT